jgi:hypothetical protein
MSRVLPTFAAIIAGVSLLLLIVPVVSASLFLVLTESSGPAGNVVQGRTAGNGAFTGQVAPLDTYFVKQAVADNVASANDSRLVTVGQLVVDAQGNGTITFVVPNLFPGAYSLMVNCPSCAQFSIPPGQVMAWVADFTITPALNTATRAPRSSLLALLGVALGVAVLVGFGFSALRNFRSN